MTGHYAVNERSVVIVTHLTNTVSTTSTRAFGVLLGIRTQVFMLNTDTFTSHRWIVMFLALPSSQSFGIASTNLFATFFFQSFGVKYGTDRFFNSTHTFRP